MMGKAIQEYRKSIWIGFEGQYSRFATHNSSQPLHCYRAVTGNQISDGQNWTHSPVAMKSNPITSEIIRADCSWSVALPTVCSSKYYHTWLRFRHYVYTLMKSVVSVWSITLREL